MGFKITMEQRKNQNLDIIGPSVYLSVAGRQNVPAKIDTGAESSSIWATDVSVEKDGTLKFRLFGKSSPFYNGKVIRRKEYRVVVIRSAMGQEQIRYRVRMPVVINGQKIRTLLSLSDRSKNSFPILIGRRTIKGKFLVDVSLPDVEFKKKPTNKQDLKKFKENPYEFHKKYVKKGAK